MHVFYFKVRPEDYSSTEYILVDPSCSGSGILSRQDYSCVRKADVYVYVVLLAAPPYSYPGHVCT